MPERFIWAVELMKLKSAFNVLEIGCGTGLLAELICSNLSTGKFTGIDKSSPTLQKAVKRNRRFINAGLAEFIVSDFAKSDLPQSSYDCIVAFNVNFFWKDAERELEIIKTILKPAGKLYVFYQAPFEITIEAAEPIKDRLLKNSFEILETHLKKLAPTSALCVVASLG